MIIVILSQCIIRYILTLRAVNLAMIMFLLIVTNYIIIITECQPTPTRLIDNRALV